MLTTQPHFVRPTSVESRRAFIAQDAGQSTHHRRGSRPSQQIPGKDDLGMVFASLNAPASKGP